MSNGRIGWLPGLMIAGVLALVTVPAAALQETSQPDETPPADEAESETEEMMQRIDEILLEEEEALAGAGYTYDAGNRRDPFVSLLAARVPSEEFGPRPEGLAGLLIDEVDVSGIFSTSRGTVAQIKAANQEKSYLIRAGDRLFDGEVVAVHAGEVVFRQEVRDATALKPFREVVKKLNP